MRLPHPWYGSILWGVEFEGEMRDGVYHKFTREEQRKILARCLAGQSVAVFSEAQLVVYPQLFADAHEIAPGCECLMHLNAMGPWAKESVYWPRQNALRAWADLSLCGRYLLRSGEQIAEGYPGTRLLNVTVPSFLGYGGAWMRACSNIPEHCAGYFLDECHDTRGFLSPPPDWPSPAQFAEAARLQIRTASTLGRAPAWINGTAGCTPASPRRYIQNAAAADPGYILNQCLASCENQPIYGRRILIQVGPQHLNSTATMRFWSALAAIGDAGVEFNERPWDGPPVSTGLFPVEHSPGTWGHGAVDENDNPALWWSDDYTVVSRLFDHALVTVDLRTRTAVVEGR